ncbi:MAG: glycoside hydrolase family 2 protein [Bacteroidales bacterium]|nr:glycoside hydrolase family 2 protein [Bacteroidales bacterium]
MTPRHPLILILLFPLLFFTSCKTDKMPATQVQSLDSKSGCISNDWQFQYQGQWYPATVPGNIHTDLMVNNLIPDPFFGTNEDSVQWVADSVWTYRLLFDADCAGNGLQYENRWLVFDGLDTYAEVWLNGKLLESFDKEDYKTLLNNMFRQWRFNVKDVLKEKGNELIVRFYPSAPHDSAAAAQLPYKLPDNRVFTRKAQYMSGWDWGPKLITCGIWKNVRLESFSDLKLEDVYVLDTKTTSDTTESWETSVQLLVKSLQDRKRCKVLIEVFDENGRCAKIEKRIKLDYDDHVVEIPVTIAHPKLWWPNGMGKQHLYTFVVTVSDRKQETQYALRHGLRTVELIREKDSIGESFAFKVNGKPCFMRGADWIPASSYPGTLNTPEGGDVYYRLLHDAAEVNMNMIRVWGGGIYENDAFYNYCDELGLMVWQDFMFACNPYPGDKAFLRNVDSEAMYQIKRLRKHPCIALWCGNNEVHNGLEDWGWQTALGWSDTQYKQLLTDFSKLFEQMLANKVKENHRGVPYISTSPTYGWGHPECCTHGCSHYWGVWWGEQPFDVWKEKTGRFMSEYGFQSYPEMATIETFTTEADRKLGSPALNNHQKHGRGVEIIRKAMREEFGYTRTDNLEEFAYMSQLVQALGIRRAIDAHRIQHDRCAGTLCWQLNDCWPVASWSSIDYTGRWKALHYQFKEAYQNVALCVDQQDVYVVNDQMAAVNGEVRWQLFALDGTPLNERQSVRVKLPADQALKVLSLDAGKLHVSPATTYALVQLSLNGSPHAERVVFFTSLGKMKFESGEIRQELKNFGDHFELTLTSPTFCYGVHVTETTGKEVKWSDNYFSLIPNVPKTIYGYYDGKLEDEPMVAVRCLR